MTLCQCRKIVLRPHNKFLGCSPWPTRYKTQSQTEWKTNDRGQSSEHIGNPNEPMRMPILKIISEPRKKADWGTAKKPANVLPKSEMQKYAHKIQKASPCINKQQNKMVKNNKAQTKMLHHDIPIHKEWFYSKTKAKISFNAF